MQAVQFVEHGDTDVIEYGDFPDPDPGRGEVCIDGETGRLVPLGEELERVAPDAFVEHAHHWLILHGRYTCTARKPKCGQCPAYDLCGFEEKTV